VDRILSYAFWFKSNSLSLDAMLYLTTLNVGFDIATVEIANKELAFTNKVLSNFKLATDLEKDRLLNSNLSFFSFDKKQCLSFYWPGPDHSYQAVFWSSYYNSIQSSDVLSFLLNTKGFLIGYGFDELDSETQNSSNASHFKVLGISPPTNLRTYYNSTKDLLYDIEENPGRRVISIEGIWFMSCWKMWFSDHSFQILPRERILAFNKAKSVKRIDNGLTLVELYDSPFASDELFNRKIQKEFRDILDIDSLKNVSLGSRR
jgi:hypothetical protein